MPRNGVTGPHQYGITEVTTRTLGVWREQAACQGLTDLFFSDKPRDRQKAKQICAGCDVQAECGEWARVNRPKHGVWAGRSPRAGFG